MSSPLGHTLMGLAVGAITLRACDASLNFRAGILQLAPLASVPPRRRHSRSPHAAGSQAFGVWGALDWRWLGLAIVSAIIADFDFLPGLLIGNMNRWHHTGSHSLLAALVWGMMVYLFVRWVDNPRLWQPRARHVAISVTAIYASHLLLDWLTQDTRAPFGIPILWPLQTYSLSSWTPLGGVRHGVPGDSVLTVLAQIFSLHNLKVALMELVLVLPFFCLSSYITRPIGRAAP